MHFHCWRRLSILFILFSLFNFFLYIKQTSDAVEKLSIQHQAHINIIEKFFRRVCAKLNLRVGLNETSESVLNETSESVLIN